MTNTLTDYFIDVQQWLFEQAVQPLLFRFGAGHLLEDAYDATGWLMVGVLQIAVMLVCIAPLQRWRPVEALTDRAAVRVDMLYTVIHRLGLFRLGLFFAIDPLWDLTFGWLHLHGFTVWHVDQSLAPLLPGVTDTAIAAFLLYLVIFDFADYCLHRAQHRYRWWWALHALHHSQRQMTVWSDDRNHLLDDVLRDSMLVLLGHMIGVPPTQFIAIVAFTRVLESFAHANVRLSFLPLLGGWGERLLVSPRYHRVHHAIGIGHESQGPGSLGGCNFAVLLPVWDVLFGTANFEVRYDATGIRDQLPEAGGQDYGRGVLMQQYLGFKRLLRLSEPSQAAQSASASPTHAAR